MTSIRLFFARFLPLLCVPLIPLLPVRLRRWLRGALMLALALGVAPPAEARDLDRSARFHPVPAERFMVVSQEAQASRIGRDVLRDGGNAVDAAVAVGFALAVTMPRAGNLGGGGFMIVHMENDEGDADDETVAIDYRETAPEAATRDMFLDADGEVSTAKSRSSGLAVGVPGTVAGLSMAHARYGSGRFTLAELVAPSIELARDGFLVSPMLAARLASDFLRDRLMRDEDAAALYYPGGAPLDEGTTLTVPALARTLERIAADGPAGFYEGPTARAVVDSAETIGGRITLDDLTRYAPMVRAPATGTFRGYRIASMPPPSSGGVHLVQMLNILEPEPLGAAGVNSAELIHLMAEAARRAYADRSVWLGDPDFTDVPVNALTAKAYADTLRAGIDPERATPSSEIQPDAERFPEESRETTHFSVIDADGNAVSNTYTLNFPFGVGVMADGAGFFLNNELDDFSASPGVPNAYGLVGGEANAVAPGKRPLSSMTPTIVLKEGDVSLVTGSPGGSRIITTVLQVILNATVHFRDIATATALPRIHHQWLPDILRIERGISIDTIRMLEDMGHTVEIGRVMGAAQSIRVRDDGILAGASDPRQPGGLAIGD